MPSVLMDNQQFFPRNKGYHIIAFSKNPPRRWIGGLPRGAGGTMFPCSQQNFPCVPLFLKAFFFDYGVPSSINTAFAAVFPALFSFCSCVPSFIFLLFPCSQLYFSFVPVFPALFSFCSCVPSFIFLLFPCSQLYFSFVPVFPALFSFCSCVPSFIFLLFPCSQ